MGMGGSLGGWVGGGVGVWKMDERSRWGWVASNSSAVRMLFVRVSEVSSFQVRLPADRCWETVVSSLSSSEGKKSDDGWFLKVLGGDSGCKGSCQLELFKVEMVVVHEGTTPSGKLDLLLCLVLGKEQV